MSDPGHPEEAGPRKRRVRYKGRNPRRFEDKYKEHNPERYADTVAKVLAGGKTPAGQHVPVMVGEIMRALAPQPGELAVDCTLGYGGHAVELLQAMQPGGRLLGLDQDPIELPKAEERLRATGVPEDCLLVRRTNFAALRRVLSEVGWAGGADVILADLGVSSMQIDNPARGFSFKHKGPLDMRMNPNKGVSAAALLEKIDEARLTALLRDHADEPRAGDLARALAGRSFPTTASLARAADEALSASCTGEQRQDALRRVFQALRIAVNDEFQVLDTWLRDLPHCLRPGGRVAVLTFHSGEDRRVKKAFQAGHRDGLYRTITRQVIRPSLDEVRNNPRAASAKLRHAVRTP